MESNNSLYKGRFQEEEETASLKDYLNLIRLNLLPIILITLAGLAISIMYAVNAIDIYKSTTTLKITKPQGSVLETNMFQQFQDFGDDRFISNEIEILKSYTTRERVTKNLIDTFKNTYNKEKFSLIINKEESLESDGKILLKKKESIAGMLQGVTTIEQKRGLDIVDISVESPSPFEAALIVNNYASAYRELNLKYNRQQLIAVKSFLEEQRKDKLAQLTKAEEKLKKYQQEGGIVALDKQAEKLIKQLAEFESQKNATKIDLTIARKNLKQYKKELAEQDPRLANYLESYAAEPYLKKLQEEIAKYEARLDMVSTSPSDYSNAAQLINEYKAKIQDLKDKRDEKIEVYKSSIFASSPEEIKEVSKKLFEAQVKVQAMEASYDELNEIVKKYENQFNKLPESSIDLARLKRQQSVYEKLYIMVEERYQEAQINVQSTPGNVLIVDDGRVPDPEKPAKPNRMLIVLVGLVLSSGLGLGFAFVRNYFDNTVKTPEDLQKRNINVLAWIPQIEGMGAGSKEFEFIVSKKPDSMPSEALRALRTRLQFSRVDKDTINTILVTSSTSGEGKTLISSNLAGSFAQAGNKVVILDTDLRKPRIHSFFGTQRYPGFIDYFFNQVDYDDIVRKSELDNLYYITAGTIPPNPAEILGSSKMEKLVEKLKSEFDVILLDSPPIIAVTDSEILSRMVDITMLVVSAERTEVDLMDKAVELLNYDKTSFIGVVLNNFSYKSGYGYYYKYYYYYSRGGSKKDEQEKT